MTVRTDYTVTSAEIPQFANGLVIAHVSDYHNITKKRTRERIVGMIASAKPDIIAISGDLVDSRHTDIPAAMLFIDRITGIAPVFFATGNHEGRLSAFTELEQALIGRGVTVLRDRTVTQICRGASLRIAGLDDPRAVVTSENISQSELIKITAGRLSQMGLMSGSGGKFTLLISHRPELFDAYAMSDAQLVLCGHAHGGQVRLPLIGGLYSPGQGLFPKFTDGMHGKNGTTEIISRGLGNSRCPIRIFNRPELVVITLRSGKQSE